MTEERAAALAVALWDGGWHAELSGSRIDLGDWKVTLGAVAYHADEIARAHAIGQQHGAMLVVADGKPQFIDDALEQRTPDVSG